MRGGLYGILIVKRRYSMDLPDVLRIVKGQIEGYMKRAGEHIAVRARGRLGSYTAPGFPTWPHLAPSTLRRKRASLRRMRGRKHFAARLFGGDAPLIDTGEMRKSIHHQEPRYNRTSVTAAFPAEIHEQDPEMEIIAASSHTPPQRAFLVPALLAAIPPIIDELETLVASRL